MASLSDTYQKKTDIEHILDAPDTYVGAIEADECCNWSFKGNADTLTQHIYTWVPGLYKCFDEGIVNAKDHHTRMEQKIARGEKKCIPVKNIEISIDQKTGVITMFNDGNGIDVAKHPEYKIWIPELIFGHLRTSSFLINTDLDIFNRYAFFFAAGYFLFHAGMVILCIHNTFIKHLCSPGTHVYGYAASMYQHCP